jgi:hypothetical protein
MFHSLCKLYLVIFVDKDPICNRSGLYTPDLDLMQLMNGNIASAYVGFKCLNDLHPVRLLHFFETKTYKTI